MKRFLLCAFVMMMALSPSVLGQEEPVRSNIRELQASCTSCSVTRKYDPDRHKPVYTVGVLEFRGPGTAAAQHNVTFAEYLTATVGQRFDPPIAFQLKPVNFDTMFTSAGSRTVDFLYVSPSPFSCVEAEYGAQSLVSHISKRVVGDDTYILPKFGGVIAARADNTDIQSIRDLKDKVVASAAISSFGGGQMQFREVQNAGMSYINDPKQVVFTGNQGRIVNGVISGEFDVGFVRTDQIERTRDDNGDPVDPSILKILEPKSNTIDGTPFPFVASTQLYPEWNLAALDFVPADVSAEVQSAMLNLAEHAKAGEAIEECLDATNGTASLCNDLDALVLDKRCDTTAEIADIARRAMINGKYAGFRTTLSYIEIRAMLQDTSFISKDEEAGDTWRCARPAELYDAISCPAGYFKKKKFEVDSGCADAGLPCAEGHQCVCNPCVKAFEVDVSPVETAKKGTGCAKMSLCGSMEQSKSLTLLAIDNKKREGSHMTVTVHEGHEETRQVEVKHDPMSNDYEFTVSATKVGILMVEIALDGDQISESPLRVEVLERDCDPDYTDGLREADEDGNCVCKANTVSIGEDTCVPYGILLSCIIGPLFLLCAIGVYYYVEKKKREADSIWAVKVKDLHFGDNPEVIGQGTFGLVLLAEYRGTQVAVKRVLPPRQVAGSSSNGRASTIVSRRISTLFSSEDDASKNSKLEDGASTDAKQQEQYPSADIESAATTDKDKESGTVSGGASGMHSLGLSGIYSGGIVDSASSTRDSGGKKRGLFDFCRNAGHDQHKAEFIEEMRLLSKLRHPCITTVMGAVISGTEDPMLVMEFMNHGSLYDILHNETMIIEGEFVLHMLRDIAQGVRFLHSADPQVIHGDLKAANVLVDSKFRAKVSDFGLSHHKKTKGATGTPFWMAPELLRRETLNTAASDMYSIGIILYELYSRKDPYVGELNTAKVLRHVCDPTVNKRPPIPPSCPPKVAKLMKYLLLPNPANRPTAKALDNRLKELDVDTVNPGEMTLSHRLKKNQPAARTKDVLYQVFPKHIADILLVGGKPEPETHEIITIFFSDIVGFTNISASLSPLKVSDLLDRLYLAFDDLSRKHGMFKIETIGDAYMCASNLATDQSKDHVKRMAEFAIDAVSTASKVLIDEEDAAKGCIEIRAGFHSGPVVSHVVGSLSPKYSIFGDTVNVSSRMESTSMVGKIQCSERSALLLMAQADHIPVRLRGETKVKGKGTMKTYWVHS